MTAEDNLKNLVRGGGLQAEPPDRKECEGLLRSAVDRLNDAHNPALSFASRFDLAYNAAHALAPTSSDHQPTACQNRRYAISMVNCYDMKEPSETAACGSEK